MIEPKCPAILGLLGALAFASFGVAAGQQRYDVEVSVREKRIADPTTAGFTYAFHLALRNLADRPQFLVSYDYRVAVDETEYLSLETALDEPIRLEPNGETMIALPVKLTSEYLFPAVPGLKDRDKGVCYIAGGMTFRDERRREKRVPFAFSGEFPVYRGFEGGVGPVEVQTLTLGGTELVIKVLFKNLNGFPVTLNRLDYKLELVGRPVGEGTFRGDQTVEGRGEAAFAVPLVLDFFEIGKSVYNGLEQPPVAVRMTGEAEVATPWGPWRILLEKSDKVSVLRKNQNQ
jgi:hypothetical protein